MEKTEIDRLLTEIPKEKARKLEEARQARTAAKNAKAAYELRYSQILYTLKLKSTDLTQTDLKAQATIGSHQERLNMILAEAAWKKVLNDLAALEDTFQATLEASYNWRSEIKAGFQG